MCSSDLSSKISAGTLSRGETLFIVGESGIGKSTFAEDLLGLSTQQIICIDGVQLSGDQLQSFHREVGWIPQLPQLAPGTVRDQFQLVKPDFSDSEIEEVLASLLLPLSDLSKGLDTEVGGADEKSSQLSGGQVRKVAIARAIIREDRKSTRLNSSH